MKAVARLPLANVDAFANSIGIKQFAVPDQFPAGSALGIIDQKLAEIEEAELGEDEEETPAPTKKKSKKAAKTL